MKFNERNLKEKLTIQGLVVWMLISLRKCDHHLKPKGKRSSSLLNQIQQQGLWVRKETEVIKVDWKNLMVVLQRLFAHDNWRTISTTLKKEFSQDCLTNPLMNDKASHEI